MAREGAHTEIEVKLRIAARRRFLRHLASLGAKLVAARVHETNTLYDTPDGNLARHGQMLRLRVERPAPDGGGVRRTRRRATQKSGISALLTFKAPAKGKNARGAGLYKVRQEEELRVRDHHEAPGILEALGVRPWFRYEKFRSIFRLPGMRRLKVALDETPIGLFLELEGPRGEIDRAAALMGFARSDYIKKSYGALFMEERGLAGQKSHNEPVPFSGVPDMLFRPRSMLSRRSSR